MPQNLENSRGGVNLYPRIQYKHTKTELTMKKLLVLAVAALAMFGCAIEDTPVVSFYEENYTVSSEGGELVIPVNSTGVDEVSISYQSGMDAWEVDPETGDKTPNGWIKLVKVIEHHTRDLAQWDSGIYLQIEPNTNGAERVGYVTVSSFSAKAKVTIKQGF